MYTVLLVDAHEPRLEKGQLKDDIFELTKLVGASEGVPCPLDYGAPSPPILAVPPVMAELMQGLTSLATKLSL